MKNSIEVKNLSFGYDQNNFILRDINLSIRPGELVCILGPSGCGKSTLLNLVAGFIKNQSGSISAPEKKGVVFQKHNLFPWKTALKNITIALENNLESHTVAEDKAKKYLTKVGLENHHDKFPHQLSLGMQQRVGLARAFSVGAEFLLMDEPFAALDAQTRYKMQQLLIEIRQTENMSILFVTHDIDEAIILADRIVVMAGTPSTIKENIHLKFEANRSHQVLSNSEAVAIRQKIFERLL
jgi:NitT/TauT family transport system ATP-binding protein